MSEAALQVLSFKTTFLLTATTAKHTGEPHVLSSSPASLLWKAGCLGVTQQPNIAFLQKVLFPSHINMATEPDAQCSPAPFASADDERVTFLCSVQALLHYVTAAHSFRYSDQLFVWYGRKVQGQQCLVSPSLLLGRQSKHVSVCCDRFTSSLGGGVLSFCQRSGHLVGSDEGHVVALCLCRSLLDDALPFFYGSSGLH